MAGLFHPILTNPNYSTIILSWYEGRPHFFKTIPADKDAYILLDTYYFAYFLSFLFAALLARQWFRSGSLQIKKYQVFDLLLVGILGILLGAKIGYILFYNLEFYLENPSQIFLNWSGMASHGAILGAALGIFLYCQKAKIPYLHIFDHAVIMASLGALFIRLANFLNAELYGRSTTLPFGMRFPMRDGVGRSLFLDDTNKIFALEGTELEPVTTSLPHAFESYNFVQDFLPNQIFKFHSLSGDVLLARLITDMSHPSQLYQAVASGIFLTGFLLWLKAKTQKVGATLAGFLVGYGSLRILTEFFRQQDIQRSEGFFRIFSMGQLLSLLMIGLGAYLIFKIRTSPSTSVG